MCVRIRNQSLQVKIFQQELYDGTQTGTAGAQGVKVYY